MPFAVGENVGPYRLEEQLGQGGMATVFKAYHSALDRYVAIKVLHPAFLEDPNFLARFQREARLVARLEHPHIVPVYDFAEHEGQPYLVMKLIEGQTLKARLEHSPLAPVEILPVAEAVGSALQYAHNQNVLHRDVKPSNVLLAKDGQIYLADFGLARIAQGGSSTLSAEMLMGTPQYISPEQAVGKSELDGRTDEYSFGAMLYELFVGQVPFSADTPFSTIHDHIYTPLPAPRSVNPAVPPAVEAVLVRALAKEPAERYSTVGEMTAALRAALQSGDVSPVPTVMVQNIPHPTLPPQPPVSPAKHSPWPWIAGGLALLVLCLVIAVGAVLNNLRTKSAQTATAAQAGQVIQETAAPTEPAITPSPLSAQIKDELQKAVTSWQRGDASTAQDQIKLTLSLLNDDAAVYYSAAAYLKNKDMWVLALMVEGDYYTRHPNSLTAAALAQLREIAYKSASDPQSGSFLNAYASNPLMRVAILRYKLYNNGGPSAIQDDLTKIINAPLEVRRYPEARLLQAELDLQNGDKSAARKDLQPLNSERLLADWVRKEAKALESKTQ